MIDFPVFILILTVCTVFGFGAGRMHARNESETAVLKRIIDRKYAKRVEREKKRTAEEFAVEVDNFVRSLAKGAPDVDNH